MRHNGKRNGMKKARHSKRNFRRGQRCTKCLKGTLDFCGCGCRARKNNNLICNVCWFSNF